LNGDAIEKDIFVLHDCSTVKGNLYLENCTLKENKYQRYLDIEK